MPESARRCRRFGGRGCVMTLVDTLHFAHGLTARIYHDPDLEPPSRCDDALHIVVLHLHHAGAEGVVSAMPGRRAESVKLEKHAILEWLTRNVRAGPGLWQVTRAKARLPPWTVLPKWASSSKWSRSNGRYLKHAGFGDARGSSALKPGPDAGEPLNQLTDGATLTPHTIEILPPCTSVLKSVSLKPLKDLSKSVM